MRDFGSTRTSRSAWGIERGLRAFEPGGTRCDKREQITSRERTVTKLRLALAVLLFGVLPGTALAAPSCKEPETGTKSVPDLYPRLGKVVIGAGRLQFYSAPNAACVMPGIFVIPKDKLIAYAQSNDGWTSVMYTNPRTGDFVQGWVKSARLKTTGTEGPRY